MRLIKYLVLILCVFAATRLVYAQSRPIGTATGTRRFKHAFKVAGTSGEIKAVTQAILDEIDKRSELMTNIEYLCDMIGPRLTGSPNLTKANQWTRDKFKQYGLSNAHLESWTIERSWTRGDAKGRVVRAGRAASFG